MNDAPAIDRIVADCERYWLETGVPRRAATEMRAELETHLREAQTAGKSPRAVVGSDLPAFAEAWAAEARNRPVRSAAWDEITRSPRFGPFDLLFVIGIAAVVAIAVALGPEEDSMDLEMWRWIWLGTTAVMAVGEMITAGFFLLPFAVGGAAATILAFAGVNVPIQLIVFLVVSVLSLVWLQRYARKEDEYQPTVGANRFLQQRAVVLEPINRMHGSGRVRLDTEEWRATTDRDETIPVGMEVRVVDVRGTRLVVDVED